MEIKGKNTDFSKAADEISGRNMPCSNFEFPVLDGGESLAWDQYSIHEKNINSRLLMGWAGYAIFMCFSRESWFSDADRVHILTGSGNNGGDGYVLAWHIISATDKKVVIWQLTAPVAEDALYFFKLCNAVELKNRITIQPIADIQQNKDSFGSVDLVVDAVFGTGLNKPPSESLQNIFKQLNSMDHVVRIAVDIPSGVYANGDVYDHTAFRAHYTYSFGSYKTGHLLEPGILCCGKLTILPVGFFPYDFKNDPHKILGDNNKRRILKSNHIPPLRKPGGHKYDSGVLTVLGGGASMEGAALMTARAFLSLGGGLAKIYSASDSLKNALADTPELMIHSNGDTLALETEFLDNLKSYRKHNVAVIGVGLKETLSQNFWKRLLINPETSVIIDGSGLGQLAPHDNILKEHRLRNLILTPHFAEAERLLGKKITNVRQTAIEIGKKYNAHVYLKGPGGILVLKKENSGATHLPLFEEIYVMSKHYELSTGGTGDVLCGVIANMLCRLNSAEAIEAALNVYFKAAEYVVKMNFNEKDFLTPSEMIHALRVACAS